MTIQGSFLDTIQSAFTFPFEKTGFNSEKDITEELEQASIGQEVGTRSLLLLQLITSLIAIPVFLALALPVGFIRACMGQGADGFRETSNAILTHLMVGIPVGFVGLFAKLTATKQFSEEQHASLANHIYGPSEPDLAPETAEDVSKAAFGPPKTEQPKAAKSPSPIQTHSSGVSLG